MYPTYLTNCFKFFAIPHSFASLISCCCLSCRPDVFGASVTIVSVSQNVIIVVASCKLLQAAAAAASAVAVVASVGFLVQARVI